VLMTPWEIGEQTAADPPRNLISSASMMLEWALLASFQADLKLFRRINDLIRLEVDNARLRAINRLLVQKLEGEDVSFVDADGDGIPDILQDKYHALHDPIIVAPRQPIPVEQIVRYNRQGHEELYEMGYQDAQRAWAEVGREVEGGVPADTGG
jgi:hypothetical protein